jgi:large subunit ribosomal protein L16
LGGVGRVHIRIFPHKPITKKPAETRQGKGKGEPDFYAAIVRPATMVYEVSGCSEEIAKKALLNCAHKLPIKVRFVKRRPVI